MAYILLSISTRFIYRKIKERRGVEGSELDRRADTIRRLVKTTGTVVIVGIALMMILDELGLDIRPALTSVGVVGLALGLGAQSLVRDVIGGIFIIFEDQFHIGDVLEFGNVVGTVESMTLRATQIRDDEGTLHIIPNDQLRVIANRTRGWSRARVDVTIPYTQDVGAVYEALGVVLEKAQAEESVSSVMVEELTVTGIEGLDNRGLRVGITGRTKPNEELEVQRFLRRQMVDVLTERQIAVA